MAGETTTEDPGPIGGQALIEGVMMRRPQVWGAAVRRRDGTIATTRRTLGEGRERWRKVPGLRGVLALVETTGLGVRAMLWGARERGDEDDAPTKGGLALSVVIAVLLAVGLFGLLPAAVPKWLGLDHRLGFNLTEGAIRLGVLVGYLGLLSLSAEVRRTFAFHGAEHMTIHAFEHGVELTPAAVRGFDRRHPRCGTAFLLLVVAVTVVAHTLIGTPGWAVLIASRVLGLPIVAAVAYEAVRFAGRHQETMVGRMLMAPGSWLQRVTTRDPDDDQIEVAIAALAATVGDAESAGAGAGADEAPAEPAPSGPGDPRVSAGSPS